MKNLIIKSDEFVIETMMLEGGTFEGGGVHTPHWYAGTRPVPGYPGVKAPVWSPYFSDAVIYVSIAGAAEAMRCEIVENPGAKIVPVFQAKVGDSWG